MAFALITKAGKKFNVQKIELNNDSQLVQRTQERMREEALVQVRSMWELDRRHGREGSAVHKLRLWALYAEV